MTYCRLNWALSDTPINLRLSLCVYHRSNSKKNKTVAISSDLVLYFCTFRDSANDICFQIDRIYMYMQ